MSDAVTGWLRSFASSIWESGQFQSWHGIDYLLLALTGTSEVDGEDHELLEQRLPLSPGASLFCGVEQNIGEHIFVVYG